MVGRRRASSISSSGMCSSAASPTRWGAITVAFGLRLHPAPGGSILHHLAILVMKAALRMGRGGVAMRLLARWALEPPSAIMVAARGFEHLLGWWRATCRKRMTADMEDVPPECQELYSELRRKRCANDQREPRDTPMFDEISPKTRTPPRGLSAFQCAPSRRPPFCPPTKSGHFRKQIRSQAAHARPVTSVL